MPPPLIKTASHNWQPELIIGIDFGMTCTGVAYTRLDPHSTSVPEPTNVQRWLGVHNNHLDDKVPTELIYGVGLPADMVSSWGSQCRNKVDRSQIKRNFKLNIASSAKDIGTYSHDTESARRYFQDYIEKVCIYVEECMVKWVPMYKTLRVEFVYSVPTTWMFDTETLNDVKHRIRKVVGQSQTRRAAIGLQEAAAAAVDIGRGTYKKGDVILVCDTGGGTTDINIVKLISAPNEVVRIDALTWDEGIEVGSTRIDQAALEYICNVVGDRLGPDFRRLAEKGVYSNFQEIKHEYGTPESVKAYHLLPIPGIDVSDDLPPAHFDGISFKIPAKEIKQWFDTQIDMIIQLSEKLIDSLREEHKKERISWMVLSGGFGLNQYVRDRLKEYLSTKTTAKNSGIDPNFEVLSASNPQLAVVRGLVYNRAQEMMGLTPVYEQVCCRISYGIIVQEEYSKRNVKHTGQIPRPGLDGKQWVHGQIEWIIKQGVLVPSKGMTKTFDLNLKEGEEHVPWECHVVSCGYPRKNLPHNISHRDVKSVCKIKVDISKMALMPKRQSWLSKNKEAYNMVKFDLIIIIGAADLRFQIHPAGESDVLASFEHDEIDIVWMKDEELARADVPTSEGRHPSLSGKQPMLKFKKK